MHQGTYGAVIKLSFPNQSYEIIHENKVVVTLNPATNTQKVLDEVRVYHKWGPVKYIEPAGPLPTGATEVYKSAKK